MLSRCCIAVLLTSLAWAQAAPPSQQKPGPTAAPQAQAPPQRVPVAPPPPDEKPLTPDTPVLTVAGLCSKPPSAQAAEDPECKTVVTKEQFDALINAISPDMPANNRRQLGNLYAQSLVFSSLAKQRGLDGKPATEVLLNFQRMQLLGQLLVREMQQEAANVPPAEVEKFYNEHQDQFQEASLKRVFIPKNRPGAKTQPDEAAVKAEADQIRARAVAGEALENLQRDLYQADGFSSPPPPTDMGAVRRESLPPSEAQVFDIKPGEVSQPIAEPAGFYVYKLESKRTLAIESAKPDIEKSLAQQRMQEQIQGLAKLVKPSFNEAYFAAAPGAPPPPTLGARPAPAPQVAKPVAPKPAPKTPQPN